MESTNRCISMLSNPCLFYWVLKSCSVLSVLVWPISVWWQKMEGKKEGEMCFHSIGNAGGFLLSASPFFSDSHSPCVITLAEVIIWKLSANEGIGINRMFQFQSRKCWLGVFGICVFHRAPCSAHRLRIPTTSSSPAQSRMASSFGTSVHLGWF